VITKHVAVWLRAGSRVAGNTARSAPQNPSAPSPTAWADGLHVNIRLEEHQLCRPIGDRLVADALTGAPPEDLWCPRQDSNLRHPL